MLWKKTDELWIASRLQSPYPNQGLYNINPAILTNANDMSSSL
jgi:hypothetical protein